MFSVALEDRAKTNGQEPRGLISAQILVMKLRVQIVMGGGEFPISRVK